MKIGSRVVALMLAAAVAIYIFLMYRGLVPNAPVCSADAFGWTNHCVYYDVGSAVLIRTLAFADTHNGTIAALAGVAVAAFTFVLWRATERLWRATRETVESSIAAERPYIYPSVPNGTQFFPSGAGALYPTSPNVPVPKIFCKFANVGRTTGVIKPFAAKSS